MDTEADFAAGFDLEMGLIGLVDGLLLWTVTSVFATFEILLGSSALAWTILVAVSLGMAVLFPLWYWVCRPVWVGWRHHPDRTKQRLAQTSRTLPVLVAVGFLGAVVLTELPLAVELL